MSGTLRLNAKAPAPALVRASNILSPDIPYNMGWAEDMLGKRVDLPSRRAMSVQKDTNLCTTLAFNAHQCQLAK